jgi:lysophospholipid acyltransferase (LPLAT)-like uncharacterized protein
VNGPDDDNNATEGDMKIRNRHLIRAAGTLGTLGLRALFRSLRFKLHEIGSSDIKPRQQDNPDRFIYCIWHENLLLPTLSWGGPDLAVLISKHADGQLLGSLITALDMTMVQGSTNRGGIEAVRKLTKDPNARKHLAITPDGPRGPRRVVQPGIVYVASRAGMKIVCVGVGYRNPWRMRSWDRFAVPKPFTRACCVISEAISVPANAKTGELETYRLQVQAEMDRLAVIADDFAERGRKVNAASPNSTLPLKRAS